jgi:hypothetical protein
MIAGWQKCKRLVKRGQSPTKKENVCHKYDCAVDTMKMTELTFRKEHFAIDYFVSEVVGAAGALFVSSVGFSGAEGTI